VQQLRLAGGFAQMRVCGHHSRQGRRWARAASGPARGPVEDKPPAPFPPYANGVRGRMVESQRRFLNGGNDLVDHSERCDGLEAGGYHGGRRKQGSGAGPSGDVGGIVACPIGQRESEVLDTCFLHVRPDPGDLEVGSLDQPPEVPI
jgi:hypothetical protein